MKFSLSPFYFLLSSNKFSHHQSCSQISPSWCSPRCETQLNILHKLINIIPLCITEFTAFNTLCDHAMFCLLSRRILVVTDGMWDRYDLTSRLKLRLVKRQHFRCTESYESRGQQNPVGVLAGLGQLALIGVGYVELRTVGTRAFKNFINLLYGLCVHGKIMCTQETHVADIHVSTAHCL